MSRETRRPPVFALAFASSSFGNRKSEGLDLRTIVRPVLKRLHAEFDETVNLAIPTADAIVYIDILESARGLRMAASMRMRDDYHSTALGKAILAYAPDPTRSTTSSTAPCSRRPP